MDDAPVSPKRKYTVLIIEDDKILRETCGEKLSQEGFTVLSAEDGQSGLDTAQSREPDLLVLDNRMPGMSGYDMLRRLRASGNWGASVPVIFFSNVEPKTDEEISALQSVNPAHYLMKSETSLDTLSSVIKDLLHVAP
jgi:DNA-binding response OmpR family regulator